MRFFLLILAIVTILLSACGRDDGTPSPAERQPAMSPQTLYLSPFALICPTRAAAEETLDYLRRGLGNGDLRQDCTIGQGAALVPVLVDQTEYRWMAENTGAVDKILSWKSVDGKHKGWSSLPFLQKKAGSFYPLTVTADSRWERISAFTTLDDLQAMLALEKGSAAFSDLQRKLVSRGTLSPQDVRNRRLEILSFASAVNYLGTPVICAQWRYAGQKSVYWTSLAGLVESDATRAALADALSGRPPADPLNSVAPR